MSGHVVITRPQPEAEDYAQELKAAGFDVLVEPMLALKAAAHERPDFQDYDAVLLTSAQGVRFLDHNGATGCAAYCVGQYTADAAQAAGFDPVVSVDGTGIDLMAHVLGLDGAGDKAFLHVRGEDVAYPIGDSLRDKGVSCDDVIVYRAVPVGEFSDCFVRALKGGEIGAVTFFSKRTAENFMDRIDENGLGECLKAIKVLSISPRVLECVRAASWQEAYVSQAPDREGMLEILKSNF